VLRKNVPIVKYIIRLARDHQVGTSLIEVLAALGLFGMIVVPTLGYMALGSTYTGTIKSYQDSKNLAESVLQIVIELPYDPTVIGTNLSEYGDDHPITDLIPALFANKNYTAYLDVSYPHSPNRQIQQINITICHDGKQTSTLDGYKIN